MDLVAKGSSIEIQMKQIISMDKRNRTSQMVNLTMNHGIYLGNLILISSLSLSKRINLISILATTIETPMTSTEMEMVLTSEMVVKVATTHKTINKNPTFRESFLRKTQIFSNLLRMMRRSILSSIKLKVMMMLS